MDNLGTQEFFQPGVLIGGRYEAACTLGSGGMGAVLKVIDRALDNEVIALKLLYPHLAQDKTSFARFRNEIIIARRLAHPNIVRLYDFGHAGKGYYFVTMEFVSGGNLTNYIYENRRDLLQFDETLRILKEIAEGMAHAHKMGVVHRDLKPDNILLTDKREVKITDFGLARSLYIDKGFTDTGEAVGTPYYMSPEQLQGIRVDRRSDIYSFGLIAYEAVVGIRPFFEENYMDLARQQIHQPLPDFATKESGIPRWFEKFVKKCAEKKPEDRFQSADEIVEFLEAQIEELSGGKKVNRVFVPGMLFAGSNKTKRRMKSVAGMIATCLLIATLLGIVFFVVNQSNGLQGALVGLYRALHLGGESTAASAKDLLDSIHRGDSKGVDRALAASANINARDAHSETALLIAIAEEHWGIANKLLDNGADLNLADKDGVSPLMLAAGSPPSPENLQFTQELLQTKRVDLQKWDGNHKTVLMYAAISGNLPVLQALLAELTNAHGEMNFLRTQDNGLSTALIHAVKANQLEIVRFLLNYDKAGQTDIGLTLQDKFGKTALFYAAESDDTELTELLLKAGLDPNIKDNSGNTALQSAKERNRKILKPLAKK